MGWLSFPALAYLLAGAHFLRNGEVALVAMAALRYSMELPFLRLTLILVGVIALTVGAIVVFSHSRVRRY